MGGLFGTARRGPGGLRPRPVPSSLCAKCNNPSINDQCTNSLYCYDDPLLCCFNVAIKRLMYLHLGCELPVDACDAALNAFDLVLQAHRLDSQAALSTSSAQFSYNKKICSAQHSMHTRPGLSEHCSGTTELGHNSKAMFSFSLQPGRTDVQTHVQTHRLRRNAL